MVQVQCIVSSFGLFIDNLAGILDALNVMNASIVLNNTPLHRGATRGDHKV